MHDLNFAFSINKTKCAAPSTAYNKLSLWKEKWPLSNYHIDTLSYYLWGVNTKADATP